MKKAEAVNQILQVHYVPIYERVPSGVITPEYARNRIKALEKAALMCRIAERMGMTVKTHIYCQYQFKEFNGECCFAVPDYLKIPKDNLATGTVLKKLEEELAVWKEKLAAMDEEVDYCLQGMICRLMEER